MTNLVFALALLLSAIETFGPAGLVAGGLMLAAWTYVFRAPSRPRALLEVVLTAVACGVVAACLTPATSLAREPARRVQCKNHLKQIGLALHNYHDVFGSFPPAYTVGADGGRLHSWRVLILPFLDEARLYNLLRLSEPWNSPHNVDVAKKVPTVYACPSRAIAPGHPASSTSYVAVTGDRTAWPEGGRATRLRDLSDGTSKSILLIESHAETPWAEPRDLSLDEALDQLANADPMRGEGHQSTGFFHDLYYGRSILLADGSVRYSGLNLDRDAWSQLLLIDDGRPIHNWSFLVDNTEIARIDNWIRLGVFLIIALFPLPWVWWNPTSGRCAQATDQRSIP